MVYERAKGAFLGLAIGDALGATTEFMTSSEIKTHYGVHRNIIGGGWLGLKTGAVTDDTEMSLCIARAICLNRHWNLQAIAESFVSWMRGRPVDIGATCRRGIRDYMMKGRIEAPQNEWDAGNGAVMRIAPVAIYTLGSESQLSVFAGEQAHITHNHPLSDAACTTVGLMVQKAMLGANLAELHAVTRDLVSRYPSFSFKDYRGNASAYVVDTLQTVFHYFFITGGFEECLVGVVNQGGDADTTGAIAGMIAGAFYGLEAVPVRWIKKLKREVREEVLDLAERLVSLSPWAESRSQPANFPDNQ